MGSEALRHLAGRAGSGGSGSRRVPFPLIYFPLGCRCSLPPVVFFFFFVCWHGRYFACLVTRFLCSDVVSEYHFVDIIDAWLLFSMVYTGSCNVFQQPVASIACVLSTFVAFSRCKLLHGSGLFGTIWYNQVLEARRAI